MASKGKWRALSETVSGLVLARVDDPKCKVGIPADAVNPASLCAPYHEIIPLARDGMDIGQISMSVGVQAVNDAIQMAKTVSPEINPLVWVQQLEKESVKAQAGYKLDPFVKALQNGDEVDMGGILKILGDLESGYQELTPMSKIDPENAVWHKTGYAPWDTHFKGLPASSLTIIGATPGVGKCLAKGTKVLMIDGTLKNVEDVVAGNRLMGPDSLPRVVQSVTTGQEMMYWVRQNRAIDYRVNESHILSLKRSHTQNNQKHGDAINISVKEWLTKTNSFKSDFKGYKVAVEFTRTTVEIEPYFMGLWLGDGSSSDVSIYNTDQPVIDYLYQYAEKLGKNISVGDTLRSCQSYSIVNAGGRWDGASLQSVLFSFGVKNNKHIPQIYKSNHSSLRWELLAGLIDSDGYYNPSNNTYEITQRNETLARDIKFLCDSLGLRTSLRSKVARAQTGEPREVFRVNINGDLSPCPIRIERKKQIRLGRVDVTMTGIKVEQDKVDTYYGFTLEGDGLFLLDDMTVTHNTTLMVELVKDMIQLKENKKKHAAIFTLEMTMGQLTQRMIDLVELKDADKERILLGDGCYSVHEVYAVASRAAAQHDLCVIAIDFADQMVEGEQTEAAMGIIYRNLGMLAKKTGVPVLLLSQLNREAQNGEMPRIHHLRYSGLAEAMAALIILIYNPKNTAVNVNAKQVLTPAVGKGYLIVGKSRYGYVHDSPGAVMVDWNGEGGWGSKSIGWFNV
jgi:replicative DNA helicase